MVRPIRETLARTDSQLNELEKTRREAQGALQVQIEAIAASHTELRAETRNLVNALRRPEVRGQWGELTLRRLVELAGMVERCDFTSQSHRATESGSIRPDLLVHLPENRLLVVDVKTPLDAYLEAMQAETETARRAAYARHATIVANRVRELSTKAYWRQFDNTPEFVILFIPGDQFLSAALAQRPGLLDDALRQNIILATPTSFVALLKAVAYGWQQVTLAQNAAEIRRLGVQLYAFALLILFPEGGALNAQRRALRYFLVYPLYSLLLVVWLLILTFVCALLAGPVLFVLFALLAVVPTMALRVLRVAEGDVELPES